MNKKEYVLSATDGGRDFFEFVMPDLRERQSMYGQRAFENTFNPYYNDTNPGLSIYENNERWYFKDFGDEDFSGDVFDFAALHYDLDVNDDFAKILDMIIQDLQIQLPAEIKFDKSKFAVLHAMGYDLKFRGDDFGLSSAISYFGRYGITKDILKEYHVRALDAYSFTNKDGEIKRVNIKSHRYCFAFEASSFAKIYSPDPKFFQYLGRKPYDYVFGRDQIIKRNTSLIKKGAFELLRNILVITGGEKDVLTLTSLGYDAICLNSETSSIPQTVIDDLFPSYEKIVLLYDFDSTGIRQAEKLAKIHGLHIASLPEQLKDRGGKDVSDYVSLGFDIEVLRNAIYMATAVLTESDEIDEESEVIDIRELSANEAKMDSPLLPDEAFTKLPCFLNAVLQWFDDKRDRDLVLLSSLGVLSSCLPGVKGIYGNKEVGSNLFLFVSAPASAGKGAMEWARILGSKVQDNLDEEYQREYVKFQADYEEYSNNKKGNPDILEPIPPKQKALFIPANTSSAKMIEFIDANRKFGVIFETEGDTLTYALKNDWSNFSDTLRKAFHHEAISLARRGNKEFLKVDRPHLSVVLSGTPNQINSLIEDVENGFFSRFMFYDFNRTMIWKDNFRNNSISFDHLFEGYAEIVADLWRLMNQPGYSGTHIDLSELQAVKFNQYFDALQKELFAEYGDYIVANIRRYALVAYRLMMVMSILRCYESVSDSDILPDRIMVNDDDFDASMLIINTLKDHLITVFLRLSQARDKGKLNNQQKKLLEKLPSQFTRQLAEKLGEDIGIKLKTVEKYIGDLIKANLIHRVKHGEYAKIH